MLLPLVSIALPLFGIWVFAVAIEFWIRPIDINPAIIEDA